MIQSFFIGIQSNLQRILPRPLLLSVYQPAKLSILQAPSVVEEALPLALLARQSSQVAVICSNPYFPERHFVGIPGHS